MRDIAAELGLSAGSLYYYFVSKQDLLAYCQRATLDELLARATAIESSEGDHRSKLARWIEEHVVCLNETYPGSLAHLEIRGREDDDPDAAGLRARRREYERRLTELIAAGTRAGSLRPCDSRLAALALLGAMNWTVQWFDPRGERGAREVGAEFARIYLEGLERSPS